MRILVLSLKYFTVSFISPAARVGPRRACWLCRGGDRIRPPKAKYRGLGGGRGPTPPLHCPKNHEYRSSWHSKVRQLPLRRTDTAHLMRPYRDMHVITACYQHVRRLGPTPELRTAPRLRVPAPRAGRPHLRHSEDLGEAGGSPRCATYTPPNPRWVCFGVQIRHT